jgi:hypothetical protein
MDYFPKKPDGAFMPKPITLILFIVLTFMCTLFTATTSNAQSCGNECEADYGVRIYGPTFDGLSTSATDAIVRSLADMDRSCDHMLLIPPPNAIDESLYRLDCYRILYKRLADSLPDTGDYASVKQALLEASRKLDAIVTENLDTSAPAISIRERAKPSAPAISGIRAIKKSAKKRAYQQAEAVIAEASIVILRAGEIPTRRNVHYTQISQAVEKNLVVLRSA